MKIKNDDQFLREKENSNEYENLIWFVFTLSLNFGNAIHIQKILTIA